MNDASDPLGIVSAVKGAIAAGEGVGQVALGGLLVGLAVLLVGSQTSAGRAAIAGSGRLGKGILTALPQTRALGALL